MLDFREQMPCTHYFGAFGLKRYPQLMGMSSEM
jgi:hypothetical protein